MTAHKLAAGIHDSAYMDGAVSWVDMPPQFPPAFQAGGLWAGLRTDRGVWPAPGQRDSRFEFAEDFVEAGDRSVAALGAPFAVWFFDYLSNEQVAYLRTTFCPNGCSATVTVRTFVAQLDVWGDYVGTFQFPQVRRDMNPGPDGFTDVMLRFVGLEEAEVGT